VIALDIGDRAALNRRAERFRREHELEKQKQNGGGGQASSLRTNQRTAHPLVNLSRSATPFANADDPEADPVGVLPHEFLRSELPLMIHDAASAERP
jgi:SAC3 family protein LENG8/THP3